MKVHVVYSLLFHIFCWRCWFVYIAIMSSFIVYISIDRTLQPYECKVRCLIPRQKTIFISNNRLLQYQANKAKQKNRQCVSSILALDSYVFFFRLTLKSYTNYMLMVALHFVSFFCLFVWFLNFDLDLFCTILHLLCFLCLFVGCLFCLWLFVLLFYCMYLIVFCLCVCVCVCVCVWLLGLHGIILVGFLIL